jgi:hypothetical protein
MKHINQLAQQLQVSPELVREICNLLGLSLKPNDTVDETVEQQLVKLKDVASKEGISLEEAARHLVEMRDRKVEAETGDVLATAILVGSIVVAPMDNWLDSLVVVQQVRSVVYPQFEQPVNNSLASRVYQAMRHKGYQLFSNEGEVNVIYLRGADKDGKPNGNKINEWSDRRLVLTFRNGQPTIAGNWAATVKPGLPAILNPLGKAGVAFIEPGQYKAWRVDIHNGIFGRSEEGLV